MKRVVYATDCTKRSAPSLRYAYRFCRALQAELHVLHVYELPPIQVATIRSPQRLKQLELQEQKEIVANYCATHLKNELYLDPIKIELVEGSSVAKSIAKTSHRLEADMVIVGMKDDYTLRGIFAGNVANDLLNRLSVPLLVLPNDRYYHGLSTLIYATDFEAVDVLALRDLARIAEPYRALIKVVHVPLQKETNAKQRLLRFESEVREKTSYPEFVFSLVAAEDVESGLQKSVLNEHADMLVMMERGHPGLYARLFHRDVVEEMQSEVSVPILVFNQQRMQREVTVREGEEASFSFE